jgi:D-beta-D-heptose 7-phosphate kinase/D-beta-D-heptose 1-phosphate adenosyltransferase
MGLIVMNDQTSILARFPDLRVLVIGDLILDHYIWGDATRISPEAPVPVIHVVRESYTAGGAANVALNLAKLDVRAEVIGTVGNDAAGGRLRELLSAEGIETGRCHAGANAPTIVKTRVVARHQQLCRIDHEAPRSAYAFGGGPLMISELEAAVSAADAVILSDYAKGCLTQEMVDLVCGFARDKGKLLAVDPKPVRHLKFAHVDLLTPNRHEALELASLPEPSADEPYPLDLICQKICERFSPGLLVITLGADGMAVCRNGRVEQVMPTEALEVFDVSGAGDTVIATLTAALAAGADAVSAAKLANRAAGVVVSKMGTATVTRSELGV